MSLQKNKSFGVFKVWARSCLLFAFVAILPISNLHALNSGMSLSSATIDLSNIFTNLMGVTASIDRAQFAETVLNRDTDGKLSIKGRPGNDFCLEVEVAGFKFAKAKGLLYDNGSMGSALQGVGFGCKINGLYNLFSGFVCTYENILSDVMGDAICSFQAFLKSPVQAFATLYIACLGIMFATGIMAFTAKETMISMLKVALVVGLTVNADFTVYYLYRTAMLVAQNGTNMVISSIDLLGVQNLVNQVNGIVLQLLSAIGITTSGGGLVGGLSGYKGILQTMDSFVNEFIQVNNTPASELTCKGGYLSMVFSMFASVPILGAMALMLFYSMAMLLIRVLFSYLTAMTGIMFLVSMSPMFMAFALFRFTEKIFTNWLKYLIGYALHIVIIFAFVSFASSLGLNILFKQLFAQPAPYKKENTTGEVSVQINECTYCPKTELSTNSFGLPNGGRQCKSGQTGLAPEAQSKDVGSSNPLDWLSIDQGFVSFSMGRMILMLVIVKLLSSILNRAPEIASSISRVETDDRRYRKSGMGAKPSTPR